MTVDTPTATDATTPDDSVRREPSAWNVPNAITVSRFVLALVLFAMIDTGTMWFASAVVFVVAASTDFLDGYYARKYGQVTVIGRVLDPFVDKIIVCGAFIFLAAVPESGICAWTAFIVLAREMLVTSLRSVLEAKGVDFSAQWSGKLKMVIQCVAVPFCLVSLGLNANYSDDFPQLISTFDTVRDYVVIATVAVTLLSGLEYVVRAARLLRAA